MYYRVNIIRYTVCTNISEVFWRTNVFYFYVTREIWAHMTHHAHGDLFTFSPSQQKRIRNQFEKEDIQVLKRIQNICWHHVTRSVQSSRYLSAGVKIKCVNIEARVNMGICNWTAALWRKKYIRNKRTMFTLLFLFVVLLRVLYIFVIFF